MSEAPYQVGEYIEEGEEHTRVQSVEKLADGVWFVGFEGQGSIEISKEIWQKIPEPWRAGFPYAYGNDEAFIDWQLPKKRGRKKAA